MAQSVLTVNNVSCGQSDRDITPCYCYNYRCLHITSPAKMPVMLSYVLQTYSTTFQSLTRLGRRRLNQRDSISGSVWAPSTRFDSAQSNKNSASVFACQPSCSHGPRSLETGCADGI